MTLTYGFELEIANHVVARTIKGIEQGTDSSVPNGFEYRTVGGHSLEHVKYLAAQLFDSLDGRATITTGCSFHIHVGGSFRRHKIVVDFEDNLLLFIHAELLRSFDRFPACVKKRLASSTGKDYAHIVQEGVVINESYDHKPDTYEFRCFGNVDNIADAVRCFHIAEDCMKAAIYQFKRFKSMGVI